MTARHTCNKCTHYTTGRIYETIPDTVNRGECLLMGDINDGPMEPNKCSGWDYEGYHAGVYVGPLFGCIHWSKK